ncbi:MAG: hypothetical protein U5L07_07925 [Desulfobacterales bacterium]|nr:hypothetical protein [Desulfobacterales bacterium]
MKTRIALFLLAGAVLLIAGCQDADQKPVEKKAEPKPVAQKKISYKILNKMDYSIKHPYRKRIQWYIYSTAETKVDRGRVAIQAALDCVKQSGADEADIRVTPLPDVECCQYTTARANYAPDGKSSLGEKWHVEASDIEITPQIEKTIYLMEKARFLKIDQISEVVKYIDKNLRVGKDQAHKLYFKVLEMMTKETCQMDIN